jgi:hypothetical protein
MDKGAHPRKGTESNCYFGSEMQKTREAGPGSAAGEEFHDMSRRLFFAYGLFIPKSVPGCIEPLCGID